MLDDLQTTDRDDDAEQSSLTMKCIAMRRQRARRWCQRHGLQSLSAAVDCIFLQSPFLTRVYWELYRQSEGVGEPALQPHCVDRVPRISASARTHLVYRRVWQHTGRSRLYLSVCSSCPKLKFHYDAALVPVFDSWLYRWYRASLRFVAVRVFEPFLLVLFCTY